MGSSETHGIPHKEHFFCGITKTFFFRVFSAKFFPNGISMATLDTTEEDLLRCGIQRKRFSCFILEKGRRISVLRKCHTISPLYPLSFYSTPLDNFLRVFNNTEGSLLLLDTTKAKDTMRNKIFKLLVSLKASRNIFLQILFILGENLKILSYGLTGN